MSDTTHNNEGNSDSMTPKSFQFEPAREDIEPLAVIKDDTTRKVDIHKAGRAIVTYKVMSAATADDWLRVFTGDCLERFLRADWGDLDDHDKTLNDEALELANGSRLMASYSLPRLIEGEDKLWIIADAYGGPAEMEPHITILFPSEY